MLEKLKSAYVLWSEYHQVLPKTHRYSIGNKVDGMLVDAIEAVAAAGFLSRTEKLPYVRAAIRKVDAAKVMLQILWETKSLENKKYVALSQRIDEVGKILGGWHGHLVKQNSTACMAVEK